MNAIRSVQNQTYKHIEIIVVNDGSTEREYYEGKNGNFKIIHNEVNSKELFGYANLNYVRNIGIANATGDYIAFLDDDDVWLPHKLEIQLARMRESRSVMACTDGYLGIGEYDPRKSYELYNAEHYFETVLDIYRAKNAEHHFVDGEYPGIWSRDFIEIHNCITTCSVIVDRRLIDQVGAMPESKPPGEDYDYWLMLLEVDNFLYLKEPCFYCDKGHGYGRDYY